MFRVEKEDGFEGWAFSPLQEVLLVERLDDTVAPSQRQLIDIVPDIVLIGEELLVRLGQGLRVSG